MDIQSMKTIDTENMFDVLVNFHNQIKDAVEIARKVDVSGVNKEGIKNIVINGLGGSAIGGDLVRSYTSNEIKIPVNINRNYFLPSFVDSNTLIIISSYSGNTEETVSAYKDAVKKNCKIICISSGGTIEKIARENQHILVKIPGGLQPRCALGYSFFTLLITLFKLGFIKDKTEDINEVITLLEKKAKEWTKVLKC